MSLCISLCEPYDKKLSEELLRNLNKYTDMFAHMVIVNASHAIMEYTLDKRYAKRVALHVKEMGFKYKIKKHKNNNTRFYEVIAYNPVYNIDNYTPIHKLVYKPHK